jgi:putative PIG3 family NAD(P)H quinone oxidoreductase
MKVIEISAFGGPEVLRLAQRDRPVAGRGEALIRVHASGVNRPDVVQRQGKYPPPPGVTDIPGLEVAGTIEAGDEAALEAAGFRLGERVCALVSGGGYAQWCVAPIGQMLPVPETMSFAEAASLPECLFTVWSNVFDRGRLRPGETVLVHGGSSGIGVMAIQMARAAGATVWVTVGNESKAQACLHLGAQAAIVYKQQDFEAEVQRLSAGRGVDLILDMVAGHYLPANVRSLAEDGRLLVIALQGGARGELDLGLLLRRRLSVMGSTLRARSIEFKALIAQALREAVWPWLEDGRVRPVVYRVFDAAQAHEAHALMESSEHIGKLVLDWARH